MIKLLIGIVTHYFYLILLKSQIRNIKQIRLFLCEIYSVIKYWYEIYVMCVINVINNTIIKT